MTFHILNQPPHGQPKSNINRCENILMDDDDDFDVYIGYRQKVIYILLQGLIYLETGIY